MQEGIYLCQAFLVARLYGKVLVEKESYGNVSKLAELKPLDRAVFNTID